MKLFLVAGLLTVTSLISTGVFSQPNFRFRHYDTKDGLASETTQTIVQDSLGYIWIQYYGGISRFDGHNFKVYQFDATDSTKSIGPGQIRSILKDYSDNIWLYRWAGGQGEHAKRFFLRYDRSKDRFISYEIDLRTPFFASVFDSNTSIIWFTSFSGDGLFKFDYTTLQMENLVHHHQDSVTNVYQNAYDGVMDLGPSLLLGSRIGLWSFDKQEKKFSRPACSPKDSTLLFHSTVAIIFDKERTFDDGIWCRVANDVFHLDNNLSLVAKFSIPDSIASYQTQLDRSRDGVLWVTTYNKGLFRFDPSNNSITQIVSNAIDPFSLRSNWLTDVTIDRDQNIWVGTRERGVSVLRKTDLEFHNYEIGGFATTAVYEADNKDYVIAARTDTSPSQENVTELLIAPIPNGRFDPLTFQKIRTDETIKGEISNLTISKSNCWIGLYGKGISGYSIGSLSDKILSGPMIELRPGPKSSNTISSPDIEIILEDTNRNLWLADGDQGLIKIKGGANFDKEGSMEKFVHSLKDSHSLSNDIVNSLLQGTHGSIWAVTFSGVDRFRNGRFERVFSDGIPFTVFESADSMIYVGTADGLYVSENKSHASKFTKDLHIKGAVQKIKEDRLGRLWLSNLEGIICYDPKEKIALNFTEQEGIDHTHGIIEASSNGTFVTANIEGISIFDPNSLTIDTKKTLPVLTKLLVNNKAPILSQVNSRDAYAIPNDISVLDELVIDYKHNNFSVEFSAMQMTAPEKNQYRHKLEGYDPDWIETDWKNRTATYTNLPAGDYTFRVKASNHHGVWSDQERTLKVKILPPLWRTSWAYTAYGFLFLGALYAARRSLLQRERLKANLKLEQVAREKEHFELEKAQEVDRVKTSFFTNISHEFRTPLTLIKGPVETLLDRFKDDPDVAQRLKLVQRNSEVLLRLINQLLDLAKLESGTMRIEKSNSEINSFIRAIAGSFESLARHKNVTLSVEISSDRQQVVLDKDKLETILINLINNAIKFTPSGGKVHVQATCGDNSLTMIVRDTGIGIPAEHQQKIFERFHQVSEAHKEIGTGIGLSLVKELIELLEGTITVSSEPGGGTTFTVMIPVEASTETQENVEELASPLSMDHGHSNDQFHPEPSHNGAPERPHVLVVEDNNDLRAFIIDSLGQEFYFLEADNGRTGLEVATTEIPDLIISDVMMPEMDGITMAGKIKSDHRSSHIPLILLTAKSTEDSKLQGLKSGADDYLTKPFNREELLLKVRNSISRQIKLREKLRAEVMSNVPAVEVMSEDERFLVQVKEKILEHLSDEQLSVESLAEDIGISRVHLYRKVSGLTGLSVNELIRKLRLQRAAQLLGQHWGPVSQVAYEVGYSNLSYFSKVFKEEFGVLPSDYH